MFILLKELGPQLKGKKRSKRKNINASYNKMWRKFTTYQFVLNILLSLVVHPEADTTTSLLRYCTSWLALTWHVPSQSLPANGSREANCKSVPCSHEIAVIITIPIFSLYQHCNSHSQKYSINMNIITIIMHIISNSFSPWVLPCHWWEGSEAWGLGEELAAGGNRLTLEAVGTGRSAIKWWSIKKGS